LGVPGRAMLQALVAGKRDPEVLAELAKGQLRKKISPAAAHIGAIVQAAQGDICILTSDVDDLRRTVKQTGQPATVVRI